MALRDQPYLPLYVQDYLTDEKLNECSPATQGVYIKLMCVMHKSEVYGTILLEQKYKQTDDQLKNFALKLVKHLPFSEQIIYDALVELKNERVLTFGEDLFWQKRMVEDNSLSLKRSEAGQKGGLASQFAKANNKPKEEPNTEYENEYEIVTVIEYLNGKSGKNYKTNSKSSKKHIHARFSEGFTLDQFKKVIDTKVSKWLNDPKMEDYLRPETLFGNKFESYLNESKLKINGTNQKPICKVPEGLGTGTYLRDLEKTKISG